MSRRLLALTGALAVVLLAGCASTEPVAPTPSPSTDREPVFESEEEAVKAAEEALAVYWAASDDVFQNGGEGVEQLAQLSTDEWLNKVKITASEFQNEGVRQTGNIEFDTVDFQQSYSSGSGTEVLMVLACIDYSGQEIVNASGEELKLLERPVRTLFEVTFEIPPTGSGTSLRLKNLDSWQDTPC